jgi:hypothetical protein
VLQGGNEVAEITVVCGSCREKEKGGIFFSFAQCKNTNDQDVIVVPFNQKRKGKGTGICGTP